MIAQKQFEVAAREAARQALSVLSPRQRAHFLLSEALNIEDVTAAAALSFAGNQIQAHGVRLAWNDAREHGDV